MKLPLSIRTKITLWYLLVTGILLLIFSLVAYFLLTDSLSRNVMNPWDMRIANLTAVSEGKAQVTEIQELSDTSGGGKYNMLSISGTRLLEMADESGVIEIGLPRVGNNEDYSILLHRDTLTENGTLSGDEIIVHLYFSGYEASDVKLLVAVRPQKSVSLILGIYRQTIIVAAVVTFIIAGLFGFIIVRRQLLPFKSIVDSIKKSPHKSYRQRFESNRNDEVGELARALNRLFAETEEHITDEHRLTSDISHELRTPLTIAQAEASLALTRERNPEEYRTALENISREIMHLSSLVDKLLFLAKTENGSSPDGKTLDLKELLTELIPDAEILCEMKDHLLDCDVSDINGRYFIRGDAELLRELVLNLIDNAVRYTPTGGRITLSLERQGNKGVISVQDTGIGIAEEYIPFIFDRFYRIDESGGYGKAGTGLGLAICRRIVRIHRGEISVESKPGEGSIFTVTLPLVKKDMK